MGELAGILVVGIVAQWVAWRIKLPAILPLIILGLCVGPLSSLLAPDQHKFIDTTHLFDSHIFFDFVSLCVGIILFEGGLTLRFKEVKHHFSTIRNLLFIGAIITLLGGSLAAYLLLDLSPKIALLFGALVIVTGPTVIRPILMNVKPSKNISTILKWEGVLIDPIGAFTTVLIYEFIISGGMQGGLSALSGFFLITLTGSSIGAIMGYLTYQILKKSLAPHFLKNTIVLAIVIFTYALSDHFHEESGLLAVTLMGIILANSGLKEVKEILSFKEDITTILISILFIALSSRMNISDIEKLGFDAIAVLLILIFLVRPLSVFLSSIGSKTLSLREKIFISYISPRGIVSAGIASVFALKLSSGDVEGLNEKDITDAEMLLPLTFLVILGTVILQGLTAKPISKLLKVQRKKERGYIFIGANEVTRFLGNLLKRKNIPVLLADTSLENFRESRNLGFDVFHGSIITDEDFEDYDLNGFGHVLAITQNTEINQLSCKMLYNTFGKSNSLRIPSRNEKEIRDLTVPKHILFNDSVDFNELKSLIYDNPIVEIKTFTDEKSLRKFIQPGIEEVIPLLFETSTGFIHPFSEYLFEQATEGELYFIKKTNT